MSISPNGTGKRCVTVTRSAHTRQRVRTNFQGRVALMIWSVRRACATRSSSLSIQKERAAQPGEGKKNDRGGWDIYPMAWSLRRIEEIINYRLDGISGRFNYSRARTYVRRRDATRRGATLDIGGKKGKKSRDEIGVTIFKRANDSELRSRLIQDWRHINNSVTRLAPYTRTSYYLLCSVTNL